MKTIEIDIKEIKVGDKVIHNGELMTVMNNDLQRGAFLVLHLFNDSYNLGQKKVKKII